MRVCDADNPGYSQGKCIWLFSRFAHTSLPTHLHIKSVTPLLGNYLTSIVQRLLMLLNYLVCIEDKFLSRNSLRLQCLKPVTKLFAFSEGKKCASGKPWLHTNIDLRQICISQALKNISQSCICPFSTLKFLKQLRYTFCRNFEMETPMYMNMCIVTYNHIHYKHMYTHKHIFYFSLKYS